MSVTDTASVDESVRVLRRQLSSLQALLVLSMVMIECGDYLEILDLASTAVPSLGNCSLMGVHLVDGGWRVRSGVDDRPDLRADFETQFVALTDAGGALAIPDQGWGWAFPLRSSEGRFGYFVVGADVAPPAEVQYLLRVLAQQTGIALANSQLHIKERVVSTDLRKVNANLTEMVASLERTTGIHHRLNQVAVGGEGPAGVASAVYELTGFPVLVEDRYGKLLAQAGPPQSQAHKSAPRYDAIVRRAGRSDHPIREDGQLLTIAGNGAEVFGVVALADPDEKTGDFEADVLEYGALVLAIELARLQTLANTELRLGDDLIERLISDTDLENTLARVHASSWEFQGIHHVAVIESLGQGPEGVETLYRAARHAAQDGDIGSLMARHNGAVVIIAKADRRWNQFHRAVTSELDGGRCRIGIGGPCDGPADFPRSYQEAKVCLRLHETVLSADGVVAFEELGVYQILAGVEHTGTVEQFVRQWVGPFLEYDTRRRAQLFQTLSQYLECGRNHVATAHALNVHRNTLKYRLQRIEQVTGNDLSDPDTTFNLQLATRAWNTLGALRAHK